MIIAEKMYKLILKDRYYDIWDEKECIEFKKVVSMYLIGYEV